MPEPVLDILNGLLAGGENRERVLDRSREFWGDDWDAAEMERAFAGPVRTWEGVVGEVEAAWGPPLYAGPGGDADFPWCVLGDRIAVWGRGGRAGLQRDSASKLEKPPRRGRRGGRRASLRGKLGELARYLGMPPATLHRWRKAGWVRARKLVISGGLWAIVATGPERRRMEKLRRFQKAKPNRPIPSKLTTPQLSEKK